MADRPVISILVDEAQARRALDNLRKSLAAVTGQLGPLRDASISVGSFSAKAAGQTGLMVAGFATVRAMVRAITAELRDWVREGIELNALFQVMQVGVSATLAANTRVVDAHGRQLEGLDAIIGAQVESLTAQKKIIAAAYESGSSLDNFLDAFRIALPLALQMGNTLDDAIDITKRLTLAATAIGVPFDLVRLQIDDIMRGVVTTRTTLARVLGITQDQLKIHRQQGTIIEYVRQKTESFLQAQEMLSGTWLIMINRAKLLGQVVAKELTEGVFKVLAAALKVIIGYIAEVDRVTGELKLRPELLVELQRAKQELGDIAIAVLDFAPNLLRFLDGVIRGLRLIIGLGKSAAGAAMLTAAPMLLPILAAIDKKFPGEYLRTAFDLIKGGTEGAVNGLTATDTVLLKLADTLQVRLTPAIKQALGSGTGLPKFSLETARTVDIAATEIERRLKELTKSGAKPEELTAVRGSLWEQWLGLPAGKAEQLVAAARDFISKASAKAKQELVVAQRAEGLLGSKLLTPEKKIEATRDFLAFLGIPTPVDAAKATEQTVKQIQVAVQNKIKAVKPTAGLVKAEPIAFTAEEQEKEVRRRAAEAVAQIRLAGEKQLLDIAQRRLLVERQLADLERPQAGVSQVERLERRAELEKQLADLTGERERTQASTEREAAKAEVRAAQATTDRTRALKEQAQELQARGEALKREADLEEKIAEARRKEAIETLRARGELRGLGAAGREVQAEYQLVAAKRELALIEATATDMNKADVARAEAKVKLLEAELKLRAQNKLLIEAAAKVELALLEYRQATTLGSEATREKAVALAQAEQASAEARVGVAQAQQGLEQTSLENNRAIVDALREQATWADSVLGVMSTLSEVVSRFSAGLPKSLSEFFSTFEALTKLSKGFVKDVQEGLIELGKYGEAGKAGTPFGAFEEMFKSWENFAASVKQGGMGQIAGIFATVAANFKASITQGIGATLQAISAFVGPAGPLMAGIGTAMATVGKKLGFSLKGVGIGLAGGAGLGALIGGILAGPLGALAGLGIGAGIGWVAGGLGFGTAATGQIRKIAKEISKEIQNTVNAYNSGAKTIKGTLAALEAERQKAIARLSGRKGAGKELDAILSDIDKAKADLLAKQKEIFDAFDKEINILRLPQYYKDIGEALRDISDKLTTYLNASGSVAKAEEYRLRRLAELYASLNRDLRDDELEAIDMLTRRIDLEKQRADVIADAAKQEREVRAGLGLARPLTPAQEAALRIKEIRDQRDERVAAIDRELNLLNAELEGRTQLFGLTQDLNALEERRLDLTRAIGEETNAQIRAIQDFIAANRAAIDAGLALPLGGTPVLPIIRNGQVVNNFTGDINVNVQPHPGMTPREAWEAVHDGIEWGMGHRHEI